MPRESNTVLMEGVKIIFRNFEGKEGQYNKAGNRNFGVLLPDSQTAEAMANDGWNVKWLKPREEDEEPEETPWLPVEVAYDRGRPPKIVVILPTKRKLLDEDSVEELDWADIVNVDLIVRPYTWEVNGRGGVKAYLQSMYVTVEQDELERKYAELEESG